MLYTLKQAGEIVELSADTLRKYIFDKRIRARKQGRDWFLDMRAINKLNARRRYNYGPKEQA
jgi:hypothetical protein